MAGQLDAFFPDLTDPEFQTAFAIFHQRYSTNTTPTWRRVQPFRFLAHNGEINTIRGNANWMAAREAALRCEAFGRCRSSPVLEEGNSDSGMLDNALELLTLAGRDVRHAMVMLIPEAWEGVSGKADALKALLPLPLRLDRAVGRARRRRLHRWALGRCGARPQRPAAAAGTSSRTTVSSSPDRRRGSCRSTPDRVIERGKLGPGPDDRRRCGERAVSSKSGDQSRAQRPAALRRVDSPATVRSRTCPPRGSAPRPSPRPRLTGLAASAPALPSSSSPLGTPRKS